jgi:hypothetical protein
MQIEVFYMQINSREKKNAISLFKLPRGWKSKWNFLKKFNGKISWGTWYCLNS